MSDALRRLKAWLVTLLLQVKAAARELLRTWIAQRARRQYERLGVVAP